MLEKVLLLGMAGTNNDFMISLPTLKSYLNQFSSIKEKFFIDLINYTKDETVEQIISDIDKSGAEIVCFSCYIWNIKVFKEVINRIKKKVVIVGGPEITIEDVKNGKFDNLKANYFVFGEGEIPFYTLLNTLDNPKIHRQGVIYKDTDFYYGENCFLENLSDQPSPFLNGDIPLSIFKQEDMRFNIETQRGCTFKCAYCLYHKNFPTIRYRNPVVVLDEFKYMYTNGVRTGRIIDANFFSSQEHATTILKGLITNNINMDLVFEVNYIHVTEDLRTLCKEYIDKGNKLVVCVGLQSINNQSLKSVNRRLNIEFFKKRVKLLSDAGVIVRIDLIIGLPHETKQSFKALLTFLAEQMRDTKNYIGPNVLRILPSSDMVEIAKKEELTLQSDDGVYFVYETPSMDRKDMVECLRLVSLLFRVFSHRDNETNADIRKRFFEVSDKIGVIPLLMRLVVIARSFLSLKNNESDFCADNYINAENYYYHKIQDEIDDSVLLSMIKGAETL